MFKWFVVLGNTPALAKMELATVLKRENWGTIDQEHSPNLIELTTSRSEAQTLIDSLGGAVKIAELLFTGDTVESLVQPLTTYLAKYPKEPVAFSAYPSSVPLKTFAREVKKALNPSFRFRLLSDFRESSGITTHYKEIMLFKTAEKFMVLHTLAVQSLEKWTQKDYDRPHINPKSGMLPPKVARMMVNCALPASPGTQLRIYDPFCGSGTILAEALDIGCSVIGSDIAASAVAAASANCLWLKTTCGLSGSMSFFQADVLTVNSAKLGHPVDAIVFEGFLGPPHLSQDKLDNYYKGLKKLYIGTFKHLNPYLKSRGFMVCALPEYHFGKRVKNYYDLIDSCEKYGYTHIGKIVTYGHPEAQIKRSIVVLQKNT